MVHGLFKFTTSRQKRIGEADFSVFVILLSIRAHSGLLPLTPAYSHTLPLMLMHKYRRENDRSRLFD